MIGFSKTEWQSKFLDFFYVAPEKIENVYVKNLFVQQAYVDGDSLENYLVGVIVPEPKELKNWYKEATGEDKSLEEICKTKQVILITMLNSFFV